ACAIGGVFCVHGGLRAAVTANGGVTSGAGRRRRGPARWPRQICGGATGASPHRWRRGGRQLGRRRIHHRTRRPWVSAVLPRSAGGRARRGAGRGALGVRAGRAPKPRQQ
ncbi:unnamed protein product, partial [Ectocarpus sp. 12 AP-2014]